MDRAVGPEIEFPEKRCGIAHACGLGCSTPIVFQQLLRPRWLHHNAARQELAHHRLQVQDRRAVDGIETLDLQPCALDPQQAADGRSQSIGAVPARCAKMPVSGQARLPRGCRAPFTTPDGSTLWKWYSTSIWEKSVRPTRDSGSKPAASWMVEVSSSQRSSTAAVRVDDTYPMGSTAMCMAIPEAPAAAPERPRRHL